MMSVWDAERAFVNDVLEGRFEEAQKKIGQGVNVNCQEKKRTVLHYCAEGQKHESIEWLLFNTEIDTTLKDTKRKTALDLAETDLTRNLLQTYHGMNLSQRLKKKQEAEKKAWDQIAHKLASTSLTPEEKEKILWCEHQGGARTLPLFSLPCLHSFCKLCLEDLILSSNEQPRCPTCEGEFDANQKENLKALFFTFNYHQAASSSTHKDPNDIKCLCEGNDATSYCTDCSNYLCDGCVRSHKRSRGTSNHQIISIEEALKGSSQSRKAFCQEHLNVELNTFCKRCEEVVCSTCSVKYHNGHPAVLLSEQTVDFKEKILDFVSEGAAREKELEKGIEQAGKVHKQLHQNSSQAEKDINKAFVSFQEQFEKRRLALLSEVKERESVKGKNLMLQKEEMEFDKAAMNTLTKYSTVLYQEGTDVEIAATKKRVAARMETLRGMKTATEIKTDPSLSFLPANQDSLLKALASFGKVQ